MTKKEYELIAESIWRSGFLPDKNQVRQQAREKMRRLIAHDLAGSLAGDNRDFDQEKFLAACHVTEFIRSQYTTQCSHKPDERDLI